MSTAYHSQSNGQIEVLNRCLQQYLRALYIKNQHNGGKYLHWTEWHYNTIVHSATALTPFQIVYGRPLPSVPAYTLGSSNIEALDATLSTREEIFTLLRDICKTLNIKKTSSGLSQTYFETKEGDYLPQTIAISSTLPWSTEITQISFTLFWSI